VADNVSAGLHSRRRCFVVVDVRNEMRLSEVSCANMKLLGDITVAPYFMDFLSRTVALNQLVTQKILERGKLQNFSGLAYSVE
jgi:hypothetical protein